MEIVPGLNDHSLLTQEQEQDFGKRLAVHKRGLQRIFAKYGRDLPILYREFSNVLVDEMNEKHKEICYKSFTEIHDMVNNFVKNNVRLAQFHGEKFVKNNPQWENCLDDFKSEAILSLFEASYKFDYKRGIKFSTHATLIMNRAIFDSISKSQIGSTFKVPSYSLRQISKIEKLAKSGKSLEEIFLITGLTQGKIKGLFNVLEYSHRVPLFVLNQKRVPSHEKKTDSWFDARTLANSSILSEREKNILFLSFFEKGKGKNGGLYHKEIGEKFGMSRQGIEQIMERAFKKLRDNFSLGYGFAEV